MEFKFIDNVLSESMLYRRSRRFSALTGKEIADLYYLNTLLLYMLSMDAPDVAVEYAKRTVQFGPFTLFRTSGTDLFMLGYQIRHPNNDHSQIKNPVESKKFLHSLSFDHSKSFFFIRQVSLEQVNQSFASGYLTRLENQLRVDKSLYKNWRRNLVNWEKTDPGMKKRIRSQIEAEMKRIGSGTAVGSELLVPFSLLDKAVEPVRKPEPDKPKSKVADVIAPSAVAAAASYWAGSRKKK